jgi:hypothetical protein
MKAFIHSSQEHPIERRTPCTTTTVQGYTYTSIDVYIYQFEYHSTRSLIVLTCPELGFFLGRGSYHFITKECVQQVLVDLKSYMGKPAERTTAVTLYKIKLINARYHV